MRQEVETYALSLWNTLSDPHLILDDDLTILQANRAFCQTFHIRYDKVASQRLADLGNGQWADRDLLDRLREIIPNKQSLNGFKVSAEFSRIGVRTFHLHGRRLRHPRTNKAVLLLWFEDITAHAKSGEARAAEPAFLETKSLRQSRMLTPMEGLFPGLSVRSVYAVASDEATIGGDFWDIFAIDHEKVALVIGDVMGKGAAAAVFTAEIEYALRAYMHEHKDPPVAMERMNAYICEKNRIHPQGHADGDNEGPICLMIAVLDIRSGDGALSIAGMEPMLCIRSSGALEEIETRGLPLGIEINAQYDRKTFHLDHGDTVLAMTDGITEARQGSEFLRLEGLKRLARNALPLESLDQIASNMLQAVRAYSGGSFRDDASLLLARRQ